MHTSRPCPGSCNKAWRRAEADRETLGTLHELTPTWGAPVHCERCTHRAHQELTELPELLAAIWLEASHGTPRGLPTGTIGRSPTHPAWPGQASRLLTDHIAGGLIALEDDIRDLRGYTHRRAAPEGQAATYAVRFIDRHLNWALAEHPAASEIHDRLSGNPAAQIHGWHRTAQRFTSRDTRLEHYRVPCPRCELLTLFRGDADDYIECRNTACGLLLTPAEYLAHTKKLAASCSGQAAA